MEGDHTLFYDEEDVLPLELFTAELDLVTAAAMQKKTPDSNNGRSGVEKSKTKSQVDMQVALLELLPKIAATIPKSAANDKSSFKAIQGTIESIFTAIIKNGLPPTLLRLVCCCLDMLYAHGDLSSLFTLVADLQKSISTKKELSTLGLISSLDCLAHLSLKQGHFLAASAVTSLSLAKALLTSTQRPISPGNNRLRSRAMHLISCLSEGIPCSDRSAPLIHNEAWLVFARSHMDQSHGDEVRVQCISILRALARSRSSTLWLDGGSRFNEAGKACVLALTNLSSSAHSSNEDLLLGISQFADQYCLALSDLALAAHPCLDIPKVHGVKDSRSASVKKQAASSLEDVRRTAFSSCLSSPLIQFSLNPGGRIICISLATACVSYLSSLRALRQESTPGSPPSLQHPIGLKALEEELIDLGTTLILIGTAASVANKTTRPMVLSGGEMPMIESCCIYVLREMISSSSAYSSRSGSVLGEVWRKKFLTHLSSILTPGGEALSWKGGESAPLSPPSIVIALKAISMLLEASGELLEDAWEEKEEGASHSEPGASQSSSSVQFDPRSFEAAVAAQSSHFSSSVRHQAALTFESLALASPSTCSRMLSSSLSALMGASNLLASSSSSYSTPSTLLPADIIDTHDLASSPIGPFTILPSFPLSPPSPSHPIPTHTTFHTISSQSSHVLSLTLAASSLLSTASTLPLGCPSITFLNALSLASRLVMRPRSMGVGERAIEVEAGLILAGALCRDSCLREGGPMEGRGAQIMALFDHALGGGEAREIDVLATRLAIHKVQRTHLNKGAKPDIVSTQTAASVVSSIEEELCLKLWTQAAALRCLPTLIDYILKQGSQEIIDHLSGLLATLLSSLGNYIPGHTSILHDVRASTGLLNACVVTFQTRLLSAFLALPLPQWSLFDQRTLEQLLSLSANNLTLKTEATDEMMAFKAASDTLSHTLLSLHLSPNDSILGPYPSCPPGKDAFEDCLRSFLGEPGGPHLLPWEKLLGLKDSLDPCTVLYPQPCSLDASLLACNVCVLGRLMAHVPAPALCSELEPTMVKASFSDRSLQFALGLVSTSKSTLPLITDAKLRELANAHCRSCCLVGSSIAIIGLKHFSTGSHSRLSTHLCELVVSIANAILMHPGDILLSRAASELFALSGSLSADGESWCQSVHHGLTTQLAGGGKHNQTPAVALAIGSLHVLRGGISMRALFSSAFDSLVSLSESTLAQIATSTDLPEKEHLLITRGLSWSLHSLNLLASSSSSSFTSSHVDKVISLCCQVMVSGIDAQACSSLTSSEEFMLGQQVARLANGLIAALGPDFVLGSNPYRWTRAILAGEMNALGSIESLVASWARKRDDAIHLTDPLMSRAATAYGLEAVGFVQQLSLFSPHALSRSASNRHLPLLRQAILSPLPGLRRAGVTTLRTLAERELSESRSGHPSIPGSHSIVAEEMEIELIHAFDAEEDGSSRGQIQQALLALMKARPMGCESRGRWMSLLASVALAQDHATSAQPPSSQHQEIPDDEGGVSEASSPPQPPQPHMTPRPPSSLRLGTRLMAGEMVCLLLYSDHDSDSSPQQTADFIHQLVDIGYKAATGPTLALRPLGIELLRQVILEYSDFPDPLLQGAKLLSQYQAQVVSALRSSLSCSGSSKQDPNPFIAASGMTLATTFLASQVCSDDATVMRRLMDLLCYPLLQWTQGSPPGAELELKYAEWVGVRYRVGLLRAHAQCFILPMSPEVKAAQAPFKALLRDTWACLLMDHTLLTSSRQPPLRGYKSVLIIEPRALASLATIPSLAPLVGRKASKGGLDLEQVGPYGEGASNTSVIPQSVPLAAIHAYQEAYPDALKSFSLLLLESSVEEIERDVARSVWFRALTSALYSLDDICNDLKRSLLGDYGSTSRLKLASLTASSHSSNGLVDLSERESDPRWQVGGESRIVDKVQGHINRLTCTIEAIHRLLSIKSLLQSTTLWADVKPLCSAACEWMSRVLTCLGPFLVSSDPNSHSLLTPVKASADLLCHISIGCMSDESDRLTEDLLQALMSLSVLDSAHWPGLHTSIMDTALALIKKASPHLLKLYLTSLLCIDLKLLEDAHLLDSRVIDAAATYLMSAVACAHERLTVEAHGMTTEGAINEAISATVVEIVDMATRMMPIRDMEIRLSRLVHASLHCSAFSIGAVRHMTIDFCLGLITSDEAPLVESLVIGLSDFLSNGKSSNDQVHQWKQQVASHLCPRVALVTRRGLDPSSSLHSLVSQGVTCLINACTLQESPGHLQDAMSIVVLILAGAAEVEALKEIAIKTLSSLPAHSSLAPAFAVSLRNLPESTKASLQSAVKEAAMREEAQVIGARSQVNRLSVANNRAPPPIQLKKFI